jgi:hypothetical protein
MQRESLAALARHHLEQALTAPSGRSAHTVYGGHEHVLRQTLIALRAGTNPDEHENPGEGQSRCSKAGWLSRWARTDGMAPLLISCLSRTRDMPWTLSRAPWSC